MKIFINKSKHKNQQQQYKSLIVLIQFIVKITQMQNINLSSYYDKISSIRAKILTKHREPSVELAQKQFKQEISQPTSSLYYIQRESIDKGYARAPLQQKVSNENIINDRLKQLDSVNDKIKRILGSKRQSSLIAVKNHTPNKPLNIQGTPKRITSLFQNQNKIVESKVGILNNNNNWASGKQKFFQQRPLQSISNKNTVQSRLFANDKIQTYKLRQERTSPINFEPFREQKTYNHQDINPRKTSDLTFADKNRQSLELQKPIVEILQKNADQSNTAISMGRFYGRQQTNKLIQILFNQTQFDIKLRQSKQIFDGLKVQDKWNELKEELNAFDVEITSEQLQRWMNISTDQLNPFSYSTTLFDFPYSQIAARFVEARSHWNTKLKEAVEIKKLEQQGFKIQEIDLEQKGFITIEDLVRYINLNRESSLRKRDIICLFKRLNQSENKQKVVNKLNYQTFLDFVTR